MIVTIFYSEISFKKYIASRTFQKCVGGKGKGEPQIITLHVYESSWYL